MPERGERWRDRDGMTVTIISVSFLNLRVSAQRDDYTTFDSDLYDWIVWKQWQRID